MGILKKYQAGNRLGFFGSGQNFGVRYGGLTADISNHGQGTSLGARYNKFGNIGNILYRFGAGANKNLRTGKFDTSLGGQLSYDRSLGKGNIGGEAHFDLRGGELSKGASLRGGYKSLQGDVGVENQGGKNTLNAKLGWRPNIGKLGLDTNVGLVAKTGQLPTWSTSVGASYPVTDKINLTAGYDKAFTKDSKGNVRAGLNINL